MTAEMCGGGGRRYRIGIAAFTQRGRGLAQRLEREFGECEFLHCTGRLGDWCGECFASADGMIFVGACGIAVRTISPFLRSKTADPAVLVLDEAGQFVISLLSGHIGGANEFALAVAERIGAVPVITTASDVNGIFAADVFARKNRLTIASMKDAKRIAAALLRKEKVGVWCSGRIEGTVPEELCLLEPGTVPEDLRGLQYLIWISEFLPPAEWVRESPGCEGEAADRTVLHLIPRSAVLGAGCRRGKSAEEIRRVAGQILKEAGISENALCAVASIGLKKDEPGLLELCRDYGVELVTFPAEELERAEGTFSRSEFVEKTTGVDNVCERAAVLAAGPGGKLIRRKHAENGVTAALAVRDWRVCFEE